MKKYLLVYGLLIISNFCMGMNVGPMNIGPVVNQDDDNLMIEMYIGVFLKPEDIIILVNKNRIKIVSVSGLNRIIDLPCHTITAEGRAVLSKDGVLKIVLRKSLSIIGGAVHPVTKMILQSDITVVRE